MPEAATSGDEPVGRLFGVDLTSNLPLEAHLDLPRGGRPLRFSCSGPDEAPPWEDGETAGLDTLFRSAAETEGESITRLLGLRAGRLGGLPGAAPHLLRFARVADYLLTGDRIRCRLLDEAHRYLVEVRLLGPVLSLWLERRGVPALHSAAVEVDGRAVAFVGGNGAGKTTLSTALVARGCALLTDDILAIDEAVYESGASSYAASGGGVYESGASSSSLATNRLAGAAEAVCESGADASGTVVGRPGYPQIRLWPDQAARFLAGHPRLGGWESLPRVHPAYAKRRVPVAVGERPGFGSFCPRSLPVGRIYLLERAASDSAICFEELAPHRGVIELLRHSFSPHVVEAAGLQPRRLERLAALAAQAPVVRLVYPGGFEQLPAVVEAILARGGAAGRSAGGATD